MFGRLSAIEGAKVVESGGRIMLVDNDGSNRVAIGVMVMYLVTNADVVTDKYNFIRRGVGDGRDLVGQMTWFVYFRT